MVGTLRAASENYKQSGRCTQSPNVAMEIATLTRHRLTSQSIFQGPRSPYRSSAHRSNINIFVMISIYLPSRL